MPFFIMIVLGRDDIADCLLALPIVIAGLLVMSFVWKDKSDSESGIKIRGKVDKI